MTTHGTLRVAAPLATGELAARRLSRRIGAKGGQVSLAGHFSDCMLSTGRTGTAVEMDDL